MVSLPINVGAKSGCLYVKIKKNLDTDLTLSPKRKKKKEKIKDLIVKCKIIKLPGENIGQNLYDFGRFGDTSSSE